MHVSRYFENDHHLGQIFNFPAINKNRHLFFLINNLLFKLVNLSAKFLSERFSDLDETRIGSEPPWRLDVQRKKKRKGGGHNLGHCGILWNVTKLGIHRNIHGGSNHVSKYLRWSY